MDSLPRTRLTSAFERRIARALDLLVGRDEPLVVACSGGPDSSAALVAVARLRPRVVAAHFDHGLRPTEAAEADRAAVAALAERVGVPVVCGAAPPSRSRSEETARSARYRWLASACAEAGVSACVTGHTLDDQAETVLLRLTRGSGLAGAAGMVAAAPWPVRCPGSARLTVLRPLLDVTRGEVERYLAALGVEAREDETNVDTGYARNRIRHRVLPELRLLNPRAAEALARFATLARLDDEALEAWAGAVTDSHLRTTDGAIEVERAALRALPPAVAARVLRLAAARLGVTPEAGQLEDAVRLVGRRGPRLSLAGVTFEVDSDVVRMRGVDSPPGTR